jgi:hypothetical protein
MAGDTIDYECWAEVSAHTNRNRETLELMADAGVRNIQIGIEAFSGHLLDVFEKGVTVMENVESLKFCSQFNISLFYNLMIGHPDETVDDIQKTLDVIDYVRYFEPPNLAMFTLAIDSPMYERMPYEQIQAEFMGSPVMDVFDQPRGEFLAPLLSTIIGYKPADTDVVRERWNPVTEAIDDWRETWEDLDGRPGLLITDADEFSVISDYTEPSERQITIEGTVRDVYWSCIERATPVEEVVKSVDANRKEVAAAIEYLEEKKLLFRSNEHVLALAIPKYDVV